MTKIKTELLLKGSFQDNFINDLKKKVDLLLVLGEITITSDDHLRVILKGEKEAVYKVWNWILKKHLEEITSFKGDTIDPPGDFIKFQIPA